MKSVTIGAVKYRSQAAAIKGLIKMSKGRSEFSHIAEKIGVSLPLVANTYSRMVMLGAYPDVYKHPKRGPKVGAKYSGLSK